MSELPLDFESIEAQTTRQLASIQKIADLQPIPGADAIEKARVLGWWVVVKKGEYKVGDEVIYCEVDSLLPIRPDLEFLRKSCYKPARTTAVGRVLQPEGFRIKTIKLRGQVSQGLCLPVSSIEGWFGLPVGTDVTELLGVRKYMPPLPSEGSACFSSRPKGYFPGFLSKTDETRIQSMPEVLEAHRHRRMVATEKLDGSSFTAYVHKGEFGVCSRNLEIRLDDERSVLVQIAQHLDLEKKLKAACFALNADLAIQGELVGPRIQKNKYKLPELRLYGFDVFHVDERRYLEHGLARTVLESCGVAPVPEAWVGDLDHSVDDLVMLSKGPSALLPDAPREGIVCRIDHSDGSRTSFKVVNPDFLLKHDE